MRGVYDGRFFGRVLRDGPSPRAWGLPRTTTSTPLIKRSIPTCVGFTRSHRIFPSAPAVHPHVRGVYGKAVKPSGTIFRSIPTCVGFTNQGQSKVPEPAVHPHVRGVYKLVEAPSSAVYGPSPRAWGLRDSSMVKTYEDRSIPTCVGFTFFAAGE